MRLELLLLGTSSAALPDVVYICRAASVVPTSEHVLYIFKDMTACTNKKFLRFISLNVNLIPSNANAFNVIPVYTLSKCVPCHF